jgi:hypothetical protein
MTTGLCADIAALTHPLPAAPADPGEDEGFMQPRRSCARSATRQPGPSRQHRKAATSLLATLERLRLQRLELETQMRWLIAYGRGSPTPAPTSSSTWPTPQACPYPAYGPPTKPRKSTRSPRFSAAPPAPNPLPPPETAHERGKDLPMVRENQPPHPGRGVTSGSPPHQQATARLHPAQQARAGTSPPDAPADAP